MGTSLAGGRRYLSDRPSPPGRSLRIAVDCVGFGHSNARSAQSTAASVTLLLFARSGSERAACLDRAEVLLRSRVAHPVALDQVHKLLRRLVEVPEDDLALAH